MNDDELDKIAKEINMTATQTPTTNVSKSQEAALEGALADLDELETVTDLDDLDLALQEDVIEEPVEVSSNTVLEDDDLDDLEMEMSKAEAYAEQKSEAIGASEDGSIKKEGATKQRGAKRTASPRTPRDMASVPAEHFVLSGDVSAMNDDDKNAAKSAVMATTPGQKKVAEKFENVFQSMAAGRAPSKYVMTAFGSLNQNKTMTSAELIAAFKTSGVGEGTARSQTGQIMALFPVLGIADRDGKSLKLKDDSNIAVYLRKHIAA